MGQGCGAGAQALHRPLGSELPITRLDETIPGPAPLTKAARLNDLGQEDRRAHCLTTRRTPAPAAAKPAHTIIKQKHSRWWEVRDPDDDLVCLTVYRRARARWCGGSWLDRPRRRAPAMSP